MSAQRKLWSDLADAQADLSRRWAHMPYCWFCRDVAHVLLTKTEQRSCESDIYDGDDTCANAAA